MKELIIFDLDGTLVNTIADLAEATNYALGKCGYPLHSRESYPMMVGNGVLRLIERALPEDARTKETIEKVRSHFTEYYDEHCTDLSRPYPGMAELLKDLVDEGIKVAVASNKYQSAVDKIIRHYFPDIEWSAIEGHKAGMPVKPDPSIVFEILSIVPTRKQKVLYVGDSGVDMQTARRACVDSVGVTWGFRPEKELTDNFADRIVNNTDEIYRIATAKDPF
ncbi:MAG: HAD family hydrolase [Paramuribaculum sp.]|nr:HAD family hydrolase [Paramuribaculum sp.]